MRFSIKGGQRQLNAAVSKLISQTGFLRTEYDRLPSERAIRLLTIRSTSGARKRVWWRKEPNIDAEIVESTLKTRERLDRAASIARAAETCADVGNIEKAIEIAFDVSHLNYEVNTLFNASSMINRISKT